jgi:S-disulfanyl-L-cysteine oxidoreductase SoxD
MFRLLERATAIGPVVWAAWVLAASQATAQPVRFDGIGRAATPAEIKAWDIDVRADFKGLPPGQGSVRKGEQIWDAQCASCHGSFGESNEVFPPMVGYTQAKDMAVGRVASLQLEGNAPTRTTMMKLAHLSTLWDYIYRAMPWTAPKSLSPDDVYAVSAYILNLANVLPADYTLSDKNIRQVQAMLPNRDGLTTQHSLWPQSARPSKPDVQGSACVSNCTTSAKVSSIIPDYARSAHGNLADQSRSLGATRGAQTLREGSEQKVPQPQANAAQAAIKSVANNLEITQAQVMPQLQQNACIACHGMDNKLVGPSFKEIATKYQGKADASAYLAQRIKAGGQGVWGSIPMPAQAIGMSDAQLIGQWLAQGAKP